MGDGRGQALSGREPVPFDQERGHRASVSLAGAVRAVPAGAAARVRTRLRALSRLLHRHV
ncbi:hypothetical protein GCM10010335_57270 [Streptomyces galbus]|nr:hypothetical protein GCM10010335_57270 [Streptomyces galbus]